MAKRANNSVGSASGLPVDEPAASVATQRAHLLKNIEELAGTFQFMGTAHPDYERMAARLRQMRQMLAQLDDALADSRR